MAVPKYKVSKTRRNMRRSHHALKPTGRSTCSACGEIRLPHTVCKACGTYRGKVMIKPKSAAGGADEGFTTNV